MVSKEEEWDARRPPEHLRVVLGPRASAMVAESRDAMVQKLRAKADRIEGLSPEEYVAREGLYVAMVVDALAGLMAKHGLRAITFDHGKPGWKFYHDRSEGYVSRDLVEELLGG